MTGSFSKYLNQISVKKKRISSTSSLCEKVQTRKLMKLIWQISEQKEICTIDTLRTNKNPAFRKAKKITCSAAAITRLSRRAQTPKWARKNHPMPTPPMKIRRNLGSEEKKEANGSSTKSRSCSPSNSYGRTRSASTTAWPRMTFL